VSFTVHLAQPAVKVLEGLDRRMERRVRERLGQLGEDAYDPRQSKRIVGVEGLRSARVGGWRVLFTVNDEERAVYVVALRPRGQAYKGL